jgi:hypothetical protein
MSFLHKTEEVPIFLPLTFLYHRCSFHLHMFTGMDVHYIQGYMDYYKYEQEWNANLSQERTVSSLVNLSYQDISHYSTKNI